jgi:hypothetical protein
VCTSCRGWAFQSAPFTERHKGNIGVQIGEEAYSTDKPAACFLVTKWILKGSVTQQFSEDAVIIRFCFE